MKRCDYEFRHLVSFDSFIFLPGLCSRSACGITAAACRKTHKNGRNQKTDDQIFGCPFHLVPHFIPPFKIIYTDIILAILPDIVNRLRHFIRHKKIKETHLMSLLIDMNYQVYI
jgi:hypothetical protein